MKPARAVQLSFALSFVTAVACGGAPSPSKRPRSGGEGGGGGAGAGRSGSGGSSVVGTGGSSAGGTGGSIATGGTFGEGGSGEAGSGGSAGRSGGSGGTPAKPDAGAPDARPTTDGPSGPITLKGAWPQQMGPDRNGLLPAVAIDPASWPSGAPPLRWSTSVGFGTAPVVVASGKVCTFGLFRPGTKPEDVTKPTSMPTGQEVHNATFDTKMLPKDPPWDESHMAYLGDEYAMCLDEATGTLAWATKLTEWGVAYDNHVAWPQASPLLANGRLYFHDASGNLFAVELATGKLLWTLTLWDYKMYLWNEKQGNASSPLLFGDTIIVSYEGRGIDDYTLPRASSPATAVMVAGFDAATGANKWVTKIPISGGFRTQDSRTGFATIEGQPTVLVPCGIGTAGVDPATGKVLWSYSSKGALPDAEAQEVATGGRVLWAPYSSYAPVASGNYVCDCTSNAHDDIDSRTYCLQISNGVPKLAWVTNDFVPYTEIEKANAFAKDGVLYGFDARGFWDMPTMRPLRTVGQFQAWDIATGKRLFTSDALYPKGVTQQDWPGEYQPIWSLLAGDQLVAFSTHGLFVGQLSKTDLTLVAKLETSGNAFVGEPVLTGGRLLLRQRDPQGGLATAYKVSANLFSVGLGK